MIGIRVPLGLQVQQTMIEQKPPKSLLQQHCQKHGLSMPRYSKLALPVAAEAVAAAAGESERYRYKVLVAPVTGTTTTSSSKAGSSSSSSSSVKRFGTWVLPGPKTYQLFADEDGWSSIEEAQNAAAARALFGLHKQALLAAAASSKSSGSSSSSKADLSTTEGDADSQAAAAAAAATVAAAGGMQTAATAEVLERMKEVYQQLPKPWAGLWDRWWVAEGLGGGGSGDAAAATAGVEEVLAAEQQQKREDFVR
jgi:hypothetical protein